MVKQSVKLKVDARQGVKSKYSRAYKKSAVSGKFYNTRYEQQSYFKFNFPFFKTDFDSLIYVLYIRS